MELIICAVALVPMIVSDIRAREINVLWLILFCAIQLHLYGVGNLVINIFLILLMLSAVYIYLLIRHGLKSKITNYLGMGDIIFLLTLTPSFEIREFTYFLIIGFVFSIICWLFMKCKKSIPLVSTLGFVYLVWVLIKILRHE